MTLPRAEIDPDLLKYLNEWVSRVLKERSDKSWAPALFASPTTSEKLGKLAGITVNPDPEMNESDGVLEIRNVAAYKRGNTDVPAGTLMASYSDTRIQ